MTSPTGANTAVPTATHSLFIGPARSGKTSRLIATLVDLWRDDPLSWNHVLVWCRSAGAVRTFRERVREAMEAVDGYPALRVQTPQQWTSEVVSTGQFGVAQQTVWPRWFEQEQIQRACRALRETWPPGAERESLDDPAFHRAILQWIETLALNGVDPSQPPSSATAARNGDRATRLARVASELIDAKARANAIGEHEVFAWLRGEFDRNPDALAGWRTSVRTVLIDDTQDLHIDAVHLIAQHANADAMLQVAMDPSSTAAQFRGANPENTQQMFAELCQVEHLPEPETPAAGTWAAQTLQDAQDHVAPSSSGVVRLQIRDEIEEAYELARRIRLAVFNSRHEPAPLRWDDCAVVAQSLRTTLAFLADAFRFYRIPTIKPSGGRLASVPIVRYASAYFRSVDRATHADAVPPDALLLHGFSGLAIAQTAVTLQSRDPDDESIAAWRARWSTQRTEWHSQNGSLAASLDALLRDQSLAAYRTLPGDEAGQRADHRDLDRLLDIAMYLDRALYTEPLAERLNALERVADQEPEAGAHADCNANGVHIVTPYAALDRRFRLLAVAGFVEGNWPPQYHPQALHLDHVLEQWTTKDSPATLWATNAEAHERQWRRLAAATLEQADEHVLLSVPARNSDGRALQPSRWLTLLTPGVSETPPLHERGAALNLQAALTASEAVAALQHMDVPPTAQALVKALKQATSEAEKETQQTPVEAEDRKLSASLLNTYIQCPRQCFYTRMLRIEDAVPDMRVGAAFGTVIHTVLEHLHGDEKWLTWSAADLGTLQADARALLEQHWEASGIVSLYDNPLTAERAWERATFLLDGYTQWLVETQANVSVVAQEHLFETEYAGATLTGRIDRIDRLEGGRLRIVDYKTGTLSYSTGESAAVRVVATEKKSRHTDADVQLATYFFGSQSTLPVDGDIAETALWFLKVDETKPPRTPTLIWDGREATHNHEYTLTEEQIAEAREFLSHQISRVRSGLFPADPLRPSLCQRCAARQVCDHVQSADEEEGEIT